MSEMSYKQMQQVLEHAMSAMGLRQLLLQVLGGEDTWSTTAICDEVKRLRDFRREVCGIFGSNTDAVSDDVLLGEVRLAHAKYAAAPAPAQPAAPLTREELREALRETARVYNNRTLEYLADKL